MNLSAGLRVLDDPEDLAAHAAELVAERLGEAIGLAGRASLALAGGSTPRRLYETLAARHADPKLWRHVTLVAGDERCVPADDPESNQRMIGETLVAAEGIRRARWLAVPTELEPAEAARRHAEALRELVPPGEPVPRLDVTVLGMGADGHTASLFPGSSLLDESSAWVRETPEVHLGHRRVTLTLPVINASSSVIFLVAGRDKAGALADVLGGAEELPAARVRGRRELLWLVDRDAASGLEGPPRPER